MKKQSNLDRRVKRGFNRKILKFKYHTEERYYKTSFGLRVYGTQKAIRYQRKNGKQYHPLTGIERTNRSKIHSQITSLNKTRQMIREKIWSNDWSGGIFITITFSPELVDKHDYKSCYAQIRKLTKKIKRNNPNCMYMIAPGMDQEKGIHFHGVIARCPNLNIVNSGKVINGMEIYNFGANTYDKGFCNISYIDDIKKVANYIAKNVNSEIADKIGNQSRYIASRNLDKPIVKNEWIDDLEDKINEAKQTANRVKEWKNENTGQEITYIERDNMKN